MLGHRGHEAHVVLDHEQSPAFQRLQVEDHLDQLVDLLVLEAADGFVEEEDVGLAGQRPDDLGPAPVPEGEHADGDVGHGADPEALHQPVDPLGHGVGVPVAALDALADGEHLGEARAAGTCGPGRPGPAGRRGGR